MRPSKSLVVRGGLVRTSGGLVSFLAGTLLCSGIYVLGDALANPLDAQPVDLIVGAFIIALATILLYFLLRPRGRSGLADRKRPLLSASLIEPSILDEDSPKVRLVNDRKDLASQRVFVDHSRIRP